MSAQFQSVGPARFVDVSALASTGPGRFSADVHPEWTIGGKPNGGYLLALLGRAAGSVGVHQHPIAASAQYLHSPEPGPVDVEAEVLRAGRSASQVRSRMSQGGQLCVEALCTTSTLDASVAPYWDLGLPERSQVAYDDCPRLVPELPDGARVAIMEQAEVRLEPDSSGFTTGRPSGRGELRGWLALPHGEPFDPVSLLFAVDAFPPATFEIEFAGWVPTLELTVYVRALPAPGPVRILQRAQLIDHQRFDETCFVWDRTGRLVAQSTQLAGVRLGASPTTAPPR
jgi:acyl-coenzyme A thioesterase PaaI-like protein